MQELNRKSPLRPALLIAALALAALALGAAPALAFEGHFRTASFGAVGSGAGQMSLQAGNSPFLVPGSGLAVDQATGSTYIADTGNHRVDEFSSSGAFVRAWGWGVATGAAELQTCTSTCQAGISGSGAGQLESPVFVAVDNDAASASFHDVYVADTGDNRVSKFGPTGTLISSWGSGGQLNGSTTPLGTLGSLCGIAVDASGNLLTGGRGGGTEFSRFAQDGTFLTQFHQEFLCRPTGLAVDSTGNIYFTRGGGLTAEVSSTGATINPEVAGRLQEPPEPTTAIAVDRANNDVYVGIVNQNTHIYRISRYSSAGTLLESFGGSTLTAPAVQSVDGLDVDDSHPHRVYVADAGAGDLAGFDLATVANATTAAASEVTMTTAKLNGSVNPLGIPALYQFEYGATTAYGQLTPASPEAVGNDNSNHAESAELSGLTPSTVYHFRIDGITECASGVKCANGGSDASFTTTGPPILEPPSPLEATGVGATIKTKVDPSGFDTHVWVKYGTSASYGSESAHTDIGSSTAYQTTNIGLSGLQPSTVYHYRLLAENSQGEVEDKEDQTFTTEPAAQISEESASGPSQHCITLKAKVNPDGSNTEAFFEYGTTKSYGQSTSPQPVGSSNTFQSLSAAGVCSLNPGTLYHYRAAATNAAGTAKGADATFETLPVARVDSIIATEITETAAKLLAKVNPLGLQLTDCHFEYTSEEGFGAGTKSVPCTPPAASIAPNSSDHEVVASLSVLSANTTYRYRLVLANSSGTLTGAVHTFVFLTPPAHESCPANEALRTGLSAGLPDCRAYEMVTPPHKNGALIGANGGVGQQPVVAVDGERVMAMSIQCFAGAESCSAQHADAGGSPYSFTRTESGWQATALSPPATLYQPSTPWSYDADSGAALFSISTPPAGQDDFYRREPGGSFVDMGPVTPPAEGAQGVGAGRPSAATQAQTTDLSHFAWNTNTGAHWPFDATTKTHATAYEYAGAATEHPLLVGVGGPLDGPGSTDLISRCLTALGGSVNSGSPGILSADGHTVYFTASSEGTSPCPGGSGANENTPVPVNEIFARIDGELSDAHTVAISEPSPSECGAGSAPAEESCRNAPPAAALFVGASENGSLAYFTSPQQLTDEASEDSKDQHTDSGSSGCGEATGPNGCNLYLYDLNQPAGHNLTAVSAGDTSGEGPGVQGVMAISADGSHVYFVAKGVLAANHNQNGEAAEAGADNLYAYQRDAAHPDGHLAFVATLPASDRGQWREAGERSNVTSDGRFFVFLSHGDLTPDDSSRSGAAQVFRYDAQAETLTRVSIGERGFDDNGNRSSPTPCQNVPPGCSEDASIARPGFEESPRRDPTMSDDGSRVFFESPVGLTPGALDDARIGTDAEGKPIYAQNVYEWEAEGTEVDGRVSCHEAAGCVSLISDGKDLGLDKGAPSGCPGVELGIPSTVCLLGASTSGRDVFFSTADQLVPQDTNTQLDYYDARVGGGFAEPPAAQICESSESCHGAGTTEGHNPSPSHFEGPEEGPNHPYQAGCKKGFVKKRGSCVKQSKPRKHHRRKAHARHRRAGGNRRGGK